MNVKPSLVRAMQGCVDCCAQHADTIRMLKQLAEQFPKLKPDVDELEAMLDHLDTTGRLFMAAVGASR